MPRNLSELSMRSSSDFSPSQTQTQTQTQVPLHSQSHSRSSRTSTLSYTSAFSSNGSLCLPNSPYILNTSSDAVSALPSPFAATESSTAIHSIDDVDMVQSPTCAVLTSIEIHDTLVDLARPYTAVFSLEEGIKADGISFQPCLTSHSQDRYVVEQLVIPIPGLGKDDSGSEVWTLTGVFDGHLGETTVEHVAHHLPIIVFEHLTELAVIMGRSASFASPQAISNMLTRAITAFDASIANDVLALFPGGLEAIEKLSDAEIRAVINDRVVPRILGDQMGNLVGKVQGKREEMSNYQKVQLNMYGTTALIALVDPKGENLWVASVGDCQAVLATRRLSGGWDAEMLTIPHNGSNPAEVERIRREHPGELECILKGRVLGAIAPFRCLGDQPFKQPPAYTRRILYNLDTTPVSTPSTELPSALPFSTSATPKDLLRDKAHAISPWERFLARNHTPPYISADPEVVHRRLNPVSLHSGFVNGHGVRSPNHFIVLCTDGLQDLYTEMGLTMADLPKAYIDAITQPQSPPLRMTSRAAPEDPLFTIEDNLALRLLRDAIGGEDNEAVSQLLHGEPGEEAWIDDITIIVQVL